MAFVCFQSSFAAMFLPETNGQATLETMEDMGQHNESFDREKDKSTKGSNENFEL
jgi:hypothetical protein